MSVRGQFFTSADTPLELAIGSEGPIPDDPPTRSQGYRPDQEGRTLPTNAQRTGDHVR